MALVALDVTVRWHGETLEVRRFTEGEVASPLAWSGARLGQVTRQASFVVVPEFATATWRDDASERRLEPGDRLDLAPGQRVELAEAAFVVTIEAARVEGAPRRRLADLFGGATVHVALAAAVHVALLAGASRAAFASSLVAEDAHALEMRAAIEASEPPVRHELSASSELSIAGSSDANDHLDAKPTERSAHAGPSGALGSPMTRVEGRRASAPRLDVGASPELTAMPSLVDARSFAAAFAQAMPKSVMLGDGTGGFDRADDSVFQGSQRGDVAGDSFGAGGLGLSGVGEGGGGRGDGVGVGAIGALGDKSASFADPTMGGHGRLLGAHHAGTVCTLRGCGCSVSGRMPPEAVQRVVRANFGRFRGCYESALRTNPTLAGRISTRFVIAHDGSVAASADAGSDLPDPGVVSCVTSAFKTLSFPAPDDATVSVIYPIMFEHD